MNNFHAFESHHSNYIYTNVRLVMSINTLPGPRLSDGSGVSVWALLSEKSAAVQNKKKVTEISNKKSTYSSMVLWIYTTNILLSFRDGCKSVLSGPGSHLLTEKTNIQF